MGSAPKLPRGFVQRQGIWRLAADGHRRFRAVAPRPPAPRQGGRGILGAPARPDATSLTAYPRFGRHQTPSAMPTIPDIKPNQSTELLKELHILTREGKLNQDSRRKLKQVHHLAQFIEPLLREARAEHPAVVLVDHGATTVLKLAALYETREARDAILKSDMLKGMAAGYDRLAAFLASIAPSPRTSLSSSAFAAARSASRDPITTR